MRLAVVAFPLVDPAHAHALESFRAVHDPQAGAIAAHFTLVFPVDADERALTAELRRVARCAPPIDFRLAAVSVSEGIDGRSYVFLEPDVGRAEIEQLHARLYEGMLAPDLRHDVTFVPHVTMCSGDDADACDVAARLLRDAWTPAPGRVIELSLLDLGAGSPRVVEVFPLEG